MNKTLVFAGVVTLVQAIGQIFFTAFSLAQYYCVIDFLREIPLIIFIRILYLHNPETCGTRINIGQSLAGVPNQAFVLLSKQPVSTTRTFYINCIYLGLCALWILFSVVIIMGGTRSMGSKHVRWPWVVVTSLATILDVVAVVTYANDSFHTKTLTEMLSFIGGSVSGLGNTAVNTTFVSWTMVLIYSRLGVIFALNLCLIITITVECGVIRNKPKIDTIAIAPPVIRTADESIQVEEVSTAAEVDVETASTAAAGGVLPRAGLSRSFRRMKERLFRRPSARSHQPSSAPATPTGHRIPAPPPLPPPADIDKKRSVKFPETLLSLPQRLESLIAAQQRRLTASAGDIAARGTSSAVTPARPVGDTASDVAQDGPRPDLLGRRGTAAELQGQLPWAYIPAPAHRGLRDRPPPGEERPPVPLPDYTAIPSFRKASVHRAASSLSSLTRKKEYQSGTSGSQGSRDVLY